MNAEYLLLTGSLVILIDVVLANPVCPADTKQYYNQDINKYVCCEDILCRIGEQPMPCDGQSTTPSCDPCPEGRYQQSRRKLSDGSYRNCRMKTTCSHYKDNGTASRDAVCMCPPDQRDIGDGFCVPRHLCPAGSGQTASGKCEQCEERVTYMDRASQTEKCKPVTNCTAQKRCTLTPATIKSDNVCSEKVYDLRLCTLTSVKPSGGTGTTTPSPPTPRTEKPSADPDAALIGGVIGGLLSILVILIVIGVAVCCVKKKKKTKTKKDEDRRVLNLHLELADNISRAENDLELKLNVFEMIKEEVLVKKYSGQWRPLGQILLGDDFHKTQANLDAETSLPESDKMHEMLEDWKIRCQPKGMDLRSLFIAMYDPNHRGELRFEPVNELIKSQYGTTIGLNRFEIGKTRAPKRSFIPICCLRWFGNGSPTSSREGLLSDRSGNAPANESKMPIGNADVEINEEKLPLDVEESDDGLPSDLNEIDLTGSQGVSYVSAV